MATDVERLIVRLEVSQNRFERQMANMASTADRRARQVESRFAKMNRTISTQISGQMKGLAAGFIGVQGLREATRFLDSATRIQNALKVTGLEGQQLASVYDQLYEAAQRNSAPLEDLVTLYSRIAISQRELNASTQEMMVFTEATAELLRLGGTSAQEASGALLQLSQALGGGVVRAEEFNSILEGAPTIARAAALGIKEAGGSVAELRKLMLDGQISSEALFRAVPIGARAMASSMEGTTSTIGQALQRLENAFVDLATRFGESSDAADAFGNVVDNLVASLNSVDVSHIVSEIERIIAIVQQAAGAVQWLTNMLPALGAKIGEVTGLDNIGRLVDSSSVLPALGITSTANRRDQEAALKDRFDQAADITDKGFQNWIDKHKAGQNKLAEVVALDPVTVPSDAISVKDFMPAGDGKSKGGSGGRKGRGGGGGRGGGRSGGDRFGQELERTQAQIEAIRAETEAMSQLNPLVDDYGYALERARTQQDLLSAAKEAGIAITPELQARIDALADAYGAASADASKLAESQDQVRQSAEDFRNIQKEAIGGFIQDMRNGVSASEALSNALNKVIDRLVEISLTSIFDSKGGGGFGIIGKIFGFAKGGVAAHGRPRTFARGGIAKSASVFGEAGPEAAVPLPDGRRIPVDLRTPQRRGGDGRSPVNVRVVNQTGVQADVRTERGPDGNISVILDKAVAQKLATRGTETNNALRQGFGARPAIKRR